MNEINLVTTSIKVDRSKRDLAKAKGLKLQDILDIALDNVLKIESLTNTAVLKEREEAIKELDIVKANKKLAVDNLNKELKTIETTIAESEKDYKKHIKDLKAKAVAIEDSIKETEKDYNIEISGLDLKIETLEKNATIDIFELEMAKRKENKVKEYNLLLKEYIDNSGDYKDEDMKQKINNYALVYTESKDFNDVLNQLNEDLMNKLKANKRNLSY